DKHSNMFSPIRLPKILRPALAGLGLAAALLSLSLPGWAQTFGSESSDLGVLSNNNAANAQLNSATIGEQEFLKVTEAYVLSVEPRGQEVVLHWDIAPEYYLYRDNFKVRAYSNGSEVPLELSFQNGREIYDEYFQKNLEVFYGQTDVIATVPPGVERLQMAITSQGCADAGLCYPPYTENYEVDLGSGRAESIAALTAKPQPPSGGGGIGSAGGQGTPFLGLTLLLAFLGGIILNLMPCVFPVLSIKAVSLMSSSESAGDQRRHGWAYTAGAVLSFLAIGGAILAIRAAGGDAS